MRVGSLDSLELRFGFTCPPLIILKLKFFRGLWAYKLNPRTSELLITGAEWQELDVIVRVDNLTPFHKKVVFDVFVNSFRKKTLPFFGGTENYLLGALYMISIP